VLNGEHTFLYDLNRGLLEMVLRFLKSGVIPTFSESYIVSEGNDYRDAISPKPRLARPDAGFEPVAYWQAGEGFEPNLSIVDLLFNEGPGAMDIIKRSARDLQVSG
jgi:hypothetical protein